MSNIDIENNIICQPNFKLFQYNILMILSYNIMINKINELC